MTNKFKHVPIAQRRDVLLELEERFADSFAETARHQFRDPSDLSIASSLHHYYAFLTGRAVEGRIRYFYADIAAPETARTTAAAAATRDRDVMCLNDHDSSGLDPVVQHRMCTTSSRSTSRCRAPSRSERTARLSGSHGTAPVAGIHTNTRDWVRTVTT